MKTLVLGYGNLLRGDDGAGIRTAESLAAQGIQDMEVRTAQQLDLGLLEEYDQYDRIVLVDSAAHGPEVTLKKLTAKEGSDLASSHHLNPQVVVDLALKLGQRIPEFYLCTIRGESFDFSEALSAEAELRVKKATGMLRNLMTGEMIHA